MRDRRTIALVLLAAGVVAFFTWRDRRREAARYPGHVVVSARAGTAALVPYSRPIDSTPATVIVSIDAVCLWEPKVLPQGIEVVWTGVWFSGRSASGGLLLWVPRSASGTVEFTVQARAEGHSLYGGAANLQAGTCRVTLEVEATAAPESAPDLAGDWSESPPPGGQPMSWHFDPGGHRLTETDRGGEVRVRHFRLLPSGRGPWFIVETDAPRPRAYEVRVGPEALEVGDPGSDAPFAVLRPAG
ncbi:MAG: hypothetical protein HY722_09460 [Planctomycetes bacterium]|nr:hypothetical protein [Planctomycetota bacterium]